jgi:hypothetical protein
MPCRYDNDDPTKCDRCGAILWETEAGRFCGECGVTMPCSMRILPANPPAIPSRAVSTRAAPAPRAGSS